MAKGSGKAGKIVSYLGFAFFALALWMLHRQLEKKSLEEILEALWAIPTVTLAAAFAVALLGYVALAFYDVLALRYVGKKTRWYRPILAGFLGFAVSNNAGHALISGGFLRYRLYSRWGFRGTDIVKMVLFSGFTYFFGELFLLILAYFLTPSSFYSADHSYLTEPIVLAIAVVSALLLAAYLVLVRLYKKPIRIKDTFLYLPSFRIALWQIFISSIDIILSSVVLYLCMMHVFPMPYGAFLGAFLLAQVLSIFSQVPGGIGVFETSFLLMMPEEFDRGHAFGALIAYRVLYYVVPLLLAMPVFFTYEFFLDRALKKRRADRLAKRLPQN